MQTEANLYDQRRPVVKAEGIPGLDHLLQNPKDELDLLKGTGDCVSIPIMTCNNGKSQPKRVYICMADHLAIPES